MPKCYLLVVVRNRN